MFIQVNWEKWKWGGGGVGGNGWSLVGPTAWLAAGGWVLLFDWKSYVYKHPHLRYVHAHLLNTYCNIAAYPYMYVWTYVAKWLPSTRSNVFSFTCTHKHTYTFTHSLSTWCTLCTSLHNYKWANESNVFGGLYGRRRRKKYLFVGMVVLLLLSLSYMWEWIK